MLGEKGQRTSQFPTRLASAPRDPGVPQCGGAALQSLCGPEDTQVLPKGHRLAAPALWARGPTHVHC